MSKQLKEKAIHRSAWNRNSANFAVTEFAEVSHKKTTAKIAHMGDGTVLGMVSGFPRSLEEGSSEVGSFEAGICEVGISEVGF